MAAPVPTHVNTFMAPFGSVYAGRLVPHMTTPASGTWGAANQAIFCPFVLPWDYPVARMFWINGSATGGNSDIGIYNFDSTVVYRSGSTANSGNTTIQYVTPGAGFTLAAKTPYYLAFAHDSVTANHLQGFSTGATGPRGMGLLTQASALPLPSPAVFAALSATFLLPMAGFTNTSSGF